MSSSLNQPCSENDYLVGHLDLLVGSYQRLTGKSLLAATDHGFEAAKRAYEAPFVILSHDTQSDPIFTYGNLTAQKLFELDWDELTRLPSRFSAELPNREERARLLNLVNAQGYIDNYQGIRISKTGRRFLIRNAVVWNLIDESGTIHGQAATFSDWELLR